MPNFAIDGTMGANFYATISSTQPRTFALGAIVPATNNTRYVFVQAATDIAASGAASLDANFSATADGSGEHVAEVAFSAGEFGWLRYGDGISRTSAANLVTRESIRRLAAEALLSNPVDGPVASGVTMTATASADAALTVNKRPVVSGVVQADADLFRFTGGTLTAYPSQTRSLFPVANVTPSVSGNLSGYLPGTPSLSAWSWQVSFMTDADLVEIDYLSFTSQNFRVIIDGAYVSKTATAPTADAAVERCRLDFASVRKARRITFCSRSASAFIGVRVGPTANIWKPSLVDALTVAVTGDSYSEGQGLASRFTPDAAWNNVMGRLLGWDDIRQVAVGSTGYLTTSTRSKIRDQIQNWGFTPDIIVCAAGYNDHTTFTATAIAAEALLAWQAMRAAAPLAPIFILGPWSGQRNNDATTLAIEAALQSTFNGWGDSNAWFIPQCSIAAPYVFGSGRVGATASNGNSDVYTSSDGVHPSDAGHEHLGRRAANDIREIVRTWGQ